MTDRDSADLSPVYARSERMRPQVSQPSSPWTLVMGLGGVGLLGLVAFTTLSNGREARASTPPARNATIERPVTPAYATIAQVQPQAAPVPQPAPPMPVQQQPTSPDPAETHWRAPAVVVDLSEATPGAAQKLGPAAAGAAATAPGEDTRLNPEERFAARVTNSSVDTARATQMRDLGRVVPQGFVIPAVLETAIDSDLPGAVRAVVSRDVRGFDGSQVLIPRGSKLIGQYRSAAAIGQTRAFVIWSRIITPAGVSIDVGSPATDRLGRGGLAGTADSHFFQRYGSSILLSLISAGVQYAAHGNNNGNGNTALVIGSTDQANQLATVALQKQIDIPTTIRVPQGAPVQVSVTRDLDFSGVAAAR
ncbi:MAG: type IV secretion system protein VirB10 [Phenylobacterium sp.]